MNAHDWTFNTEDDNSCDDHVTRTFECANCGLHFEQAFWDLPPGDGPPEEPDLSEPLDRTAPECLPCPKGGVA